MKRASQWLLLPVIVAGTQHFAQAQADSTAFRCVLYIEKLPELLSGGQPISVVEAVQQRLIYPRAALQARVQGRAFVSFTITAKGLVQGAHLIKGFRPDCDSAALQAVRRLPRFQPAIQLNKPVACAYTVPVTFRLAPKRQHVK